MKKIFFEIFQKNTAFYVNVAMSCSCISSVNVDKIYQGKNIGVQGFILEVKLQLP